MKFNFQSVLKPQQIYHHPRLSSINHFFPPTALNTKGIWFGRKTITLSQIGLLSASVPVKVCQVFGAPLPAPPTPTAPSSHGDVGWLLLLASPSAVWDALCELLSGGKLWQAYLPWRSLTWKKVGKTRRGWSGSQLHQTPSSTSETEKGSVPS